MNDTVHLPEKEKLIDDCRQSMDSLIRAFLGQIQNKELVGDAISFLSVAHFTILLHRFPPDHWDKLMVVYNTKMFDLFGEVPKYVEWATKESQNANSKGHS